ncbi:unnamed protein product [Discosporangium mesarthrocarpum]
MSGSSTNEGFHISPPSCLGRTVLLGYCDVAAAGLRALEGLSPQSAGGGLQEVGRENLRVNGAKELFTGIPLLEVVHFEGGDSKEPLPLSLMKLNFDVGQELGTPMALALVELFAKHFDALELDKVVIAAGVQAPRRSQRKPASDAQPPPDTVCTVASGCELPSALAGLPSLPKATRLSDTFLTMLVRLFQIEERPMVVLAKDSYRVAADSPADDGTDQAIEGLGMSLASAFGLEFNMEGSARLRRQKKATATLGIPGYI